MDGLAPPLKAVIEVRLSIEAGESVTRALQAYVLAVEDDFAKMISESLSARLRGRPLSKDQYRELNIYRRAVLDILMAGLSGEPILPRLRELEKRLVEASDADLERQVAVLPLRAMIPMLLLQLPAFFLLMIGPILNDLLRGLAQ